MNDDEILEAPPAPEGDDQSAAVGVELDRDAVAELEAELEADLASSSSEADG